MRKNGLLINEQGSVLIFAYFLIVILLGFGAAFLKIATGDAQIAERQRLTTMAFHIAEAGIERALYDLRQDFINDPTPSWSDGYINGLTTGTDFNNYFTIPYANTTINGGTYVVKGKNVAVTDDIWIQSTGTINGVNHTLRVYVKIIDLSPWANAIFAGGNASGAMVNGNVDVRGSVHILGEGLNPGDLAISLGGNATFVGNNYSGLDSSLAAKVPVLSTVTYGGEVVQTLNAELRVRKGDISLSGSATVGQTNATANTVKETVDGIYVNDNFVGDKGAANAFSDNGTSEAYDLGNAVAFPSLSDPHPNNINQTFQEYYSQHALVLTNELSNITPSSSFSYSNANGSISMNGSGHLTISGQVYVSGNNNLNMAKQGSNKVITYSGTGSLLVTGSAQINVNLVTSGNNSFPNNIIGVMTPNNIVFDEAQTDVMGVFYAETEIRVARQTDIMGTIVSNYFDMGSNVPAIYQVPDTVNHMPPGMIGSNARWYLVVVWQKI